VSEWPDLFYRWLIASGFMGDAHQQTAPKERP
jgi:hypothetical protein